MFMNTRVTKWTSAAVLTAGIIIAPATSFAAASQTNGSSTNTPSSLHSLITQAQNDTNSSDLSQCGTLCQAIKTAGAQEITNRINSLNKVEPKISTFKNVSASDQAYLTSEVNGEISGLTALKTKLAGDQTLSSALSDAESIYTDYRVYAIVLPKIKIVRITADQQATEAQLSTSATSLQAKITADSKKGDDVTTLQDDLNDMTAQINSAEQISSPMQQKVLPLLPSDYNSNHNVLSGDFSQLKTAQSDLQNARKDAKNIEAGLKSLK